MGGPGIGYDAGHLEHGLVRQVADTRRLFLAGRLGVGNDGIADMDGDQGLVLPEPSTIQMSIKVSGQNILKHGMNL